MKRSRGRSAMNVEAALIRRFHTHASLRINCGWSKVWVS